MIYSIQKYGFILFLLLIFLSCSEEAKHKITLEEGIDTSAGGGVSYIITTPLATYYLDKVGGGLSSIIDKDGVDWLGFHNKKGSGHQGEYRGFPNAIHKQDGSFFHAVNAGTSPSISTIEKESPEHIRIRFVSENKQWEGQWDFYPERCDFTMTKISDGYKYWVLYEGVPGGEMDSTDFWFSSFNKKEQLINEPFEGDLPHPEWMAFGDRQSPRTIYILHHEDDELPDTYVSRPYMTVFGFGRQNKDKFLDTQQTFSIGFVESTDYTKVENAIKEVLK